jgi:phospholipase/carboxylesterase
LPPDIEEPVTYMNRIQLLEQAGTASKPTPLSKRRKFVTSAANSQHEHSFFVPLHYEPNYAYPLIVWLHGPCDGHRQLRQVMPHVSVRNYVGVAPNSPSSQRDLSSDAHPWRQEAGAIVQSLQRVEQCVAQAQARFHIAPHRVFLAGFDCGGTMALRLGLAAPGRFAGAASLGGPFPEGHHPMSNLLQARKLPVLISYGRDSDSYPINQVCAELRLFHVAGMSLNLRQYPCGHELTTQMLSDLDAWIMQIVTGVGSSASDGAHEPNLGELN